MVMLVGYFVLFMALAAEALLLYLVMTTPMQTGWRGKSRL
jgi:hypothetical protein